MVFSGFKGKLTDLSPGNAYWNSGGTANDRAVWKAAQNRAGYRVFTVRHNSTVLTLDHVTIQACHGPSGGTQDDLIGMAHSVIWTEDADYHAFVSEINIYNSSIINNSRGTSDICCIRNGNSRIYNNTFTSNTAAYVASAEFLPSYAATAISRGYIAFINNTVRNSGNARIGLLDHMDHTATTNTTPGSAFFANNIFVGTSTSPSRIATGNSIGDYCLSNIMANATYTTYGYYDRGISATTGTTYTPTEFAAYFESTTSADNLVTGTYAGRIHHKILELNNSSNPIIGRVNNLDDIGSRVYDTEGFSNLSYDQMGKVRPQNRSIGSIDIYGFKVLDGDVRIYYNSDGGGTPANKTIDLSSYVLNYPNGLNQNNATFAITSTTLPNGSVSPLSGRNVTFTPGGTYSLTPEGSFTFKVSGTATDGLFYEETATVHIQVRDLNLDIDNLYLPGYDGAQDVIVQCKIEMKPVDFLPKYKFITGAFNNNTINNGTTYDDIKVSNDDHSGQVYDYHIPLVGDLNGDGRPEIVALGRTSVGTTPTNFNLTVDAIHIFNGQTGKKLLTFSGTNLPSFAPFGDGYHGSPGAMALINSDEYLGDKDVEVILAVGQTASTTTSKRLFSYVIQYNPSTEVWSMKKNPKWTANPPYANDNANTPDFSTPILQIVDFDKDGKAEILAYNKIFDAETGTLKLTYETLREDPALLPGSAYVGRDFRGKEAGTGAKGNSKIGFSYVYDLDGDGTYEICAGGKVYYNIKLNAGTNTGTYSVLNIMDKLPATEKAWLEGSGAATGVTTKRAFTDARTAVADIDGDGLPEIVASYYVESNFLFDGAAVATAGSANKLRIVAWNANLDTIAPDPVTVTLKAIQNIPLSNYATDGTYSYMYIADVDGRVQNGKKLPEISLLGPMFYCYMYGSTWTGYPIHPNVADSMATSYPRSGKPLQEDADKANGSLLSFTWDNTPGTSVFDRLKVSFMMEHSDRSVNTGISLFDFDNDGINEICYRDERTLRIIRPIQPFVSLLEGEAAISDVILFRKNVTSNTGFEYPVIVDLDGDYSGDILVSGSENKSTSDFLYAVQGANVDLAPARTVWNQFMYSPLKVTDRLTVPHKDSIPPHPLSPSAAFYKKETDSYETYIYNMNIGQVPYFSVDPSGGKAVYAPLVKIPNAIISDLKFVDGGADVDTIQFVITNDGAAAINANTPIKIYDGETASAGTIYIDTIVGSSVYPGGYVTIKLPLKEKIHNSKTFLIRVSDDSFEGMKGDIFLDPDNESSFADCFWNDNWDILSYFSLKPDFYTVLPGETVVLDVLANDILTRFLPAVKTIEDFKVELEGDPTQTIPVVNKKLQFTAPATGGLIVYKYTYIAETLLSTGYIYIYVAELDPANTLLCAGSQYVLHVNPVGTGVTIKYYASNGTTDIGDNYTFTPVATESQRTFFVQPIFSGTPYGVTIGDFLPKKRIDFKVTTNALGALATMRWTGAADYNWHNPANWVLVGANGNTSVVTYYPNTCVNVVIPAGLTRYPELTDEAFCNDITMGDRAMIAGIHKLTYQKARVELTLRPSEKDRFVMWSAPLKSVYTGDYHYEDEASSSSIKYYWGDVYMNFFQRRHPDDLTGILPGVNSFFTATFSSMQEELELGLAFNVKVTSATINKDKPFIFPQTYMAYTTGAYTGYIYSRNKGDKFILDKDDALPHMLPVHNDIEGSNFAQIVNPYMAYLDVNKFLQANSSLIKTTGYAIWNENNLSQISYVPNAHYRFTLLTNPSMSDPTGFIPPLQSFFVEKTGTAKLPITGLAISPEWVTTKKDSPYSLRADAGAPETNILRIKATQEKRVSYALLHYNENTSPAYISNEDMHKVFYQLEKDTIPLEVYTFAPTREVLAINSSSDFSQEVPIGLRTDRAGQVTLEFSGMATFGHNVYLIDHAQNDKITDLQQSPTYTFTVTKKSASDKIIELNDRFSLRSDFTGIGLGNETISSTGLNVTSRDGYIYVQTSSPVSSLQVYSLTGAQVYGSTTRTDYFRIPTDGQQAYIVKVKIGEEYLTQKVFVK
jgi:hypothetical protein